MWLITKTAILMLIIICSVTGRLGIRYDNYRLNNCLQTLFPSRARRIVGGTDSKFGTWPWQAAVYKDGNMENIRCGATLISSQWLVSAGHCFFNTQGDRWMVRLGAFRTGVNNIRSPDEEVRAISNVFIHPEYISTSLINDISILRMEEPVRFTDFIRPICLPPSTDDIRDGRLCTIIGWGRLHEIEFKYPNILQEVQIPLISTEECRKRIQFFPEPTAILTSNMFCAGFDQGGRDACQGDSGGPLMCQELDGRWTLQGVTSKGYGCARANSPGVYTKVAGYVTWIDQLIDRT